MVRTIRLKGTGVPEAPPWDPAVNLPSCGRCGNQHFCEFYTWVDGMWLGDPCLTPDERERWTKVFEDRHQGKVAVPAVGK